MTQIDPRNLSGANFNIVDQQKFQQGLAMIRDSLFDKGATMFCADNIITWNRNLSFLREDFFLDILRDDKNSVVEKSIVWRTYVFMYFAEMAANIEGDYMELGCHTGYTASMLVKKLDFKKLGKKYYLYDLFGWKEGDGHTHFPAHDDAQMYEKVVARFADHPYVTVTRGSVPQTFEQAFPAGKVAFAHIDMNHPDPEKGALKRILPILSPGGIIILDDYGWWGYSAQKVALDPIIAEAGLKVLELPTGQALLMKPY